MNPTAELDRFTSARDSDGWIEVHHGAGLVERHHVSRWLLPAGPADLRMLRRCTGPTLDIGCGPGRLTAALIARGVPVLGVDISTDAVRRTTARGAPALRLDVFEPLPGEGCWHWALLADGNIGIGGDPVRLLRRVGRLVRRGGGAIVEISPRELDHRGTSRLRAPDGVLGRPFAWAALGPRALSGAAAVAGWQVAECWRDGDRCFAELRRRPDRAASGSPVDT